MIYDTYWYRSITSHEPTEKDASLDCHKHSHIVNRKKVEANSHIFENKEEH